ncbi:hypothetical protein [Kangiella sediminilitoris]|uniref:Uncharacterized protein n=1 Tax=Kangiella sediminilitoris TaxID=1144748 RepID=A0A1B3BCL6_9GAMM|nr:hypothetical protein [Kangiella sediminilitoris]AOE50556.1 hypothetical protein KS2013_1847 [Kangiella sediminilitoris]
MNNEQDLLKQLNNLPDAANAPDRWSEIRQQIESESATSKQKPWWSMAIAASLLVAAIVSTLFLPEGQQTGTDSVVTTDKKSDDHNQVFALTIQSLQQANATYYAVLGQQIRAEEIWLSEKTRVSLESLRDAQQQYRQVLAQEPDNGKAKQRLFWLYQKERELLRQILVA